MVPVAVLPPGICRIGSKGNGSWLGPAWNLPCVARASNFPESTEMLVSAKLMFLMDSLQGQIKNPCSFIMFFPCWVQVVNSLEANEILLF